MSNLVSIMAMDSQNAETTASIGQNTNELVAKIEEFIASIHSAQLTLDSQANIAKEFTSARLVLKQEFNNLRSELNASIGLLKDLITIAEKNAKAISIIPRAN